jgi:hypothetical protein
MGARPHRWDRPTRRADGPAKRGRPNWARGLTAETSDSIARNAAARRGRPRGPGRSGPALRMYPLGRVEWSQELAYAVGLIATDGCLTGGGITFTNTDRRLVEIFLECVGQRVKVGVQFRPRRCPRTGRSLATVRCTRG